MMNRSTIENLHKSYLDELDKLTAFYKLGERAVAVFVVTPNWRGDDCELHDKPRILAELDVYLKYEEYTDSVDTQQEGVTNRYFDLACVSDLTSSELRIYTEYKRLAEQWNQNEISWLPPSDAPDPRRQRPSRRRRRPASVTP